MSVAMSLTELKVIYHGQWKRVAVDGGLRRKMSLFRFNRGCGSKSPKNNTLCGVNEQMNCMVCFQIEKKKVLAGG